MFLAWFKVNRTSIYMNLLCLLACTFSVSEHSLFSYLSVLEYSGHKPSFFAEGNVLFACNAGVCKYVLEGHIGVVRCLHLKEDRLVSGGDRKRIVVWNVKVRACHYRTECMYNECILHVRVHLPLCLHFRQGSSYIQFTGSRCYSTGCVLQTLRSSLHLLTPQEPLASSHTGSCLCMYVHVLGAIM